MTAVVWLLVIVVAVLAMFVVGLLRSHAEIIRALHDAGVNLDPDRDQEHNHDDRHSGRGRSDSDTTVVTDTPPTIRTVDGVPEPADVSGRRASDLVGLTPSGATRTVAVTGTGEATLLAFLTTGCSTCAHFWGAFADGVKLPDDARLVIVTKGPDEESPADVDALAAPHLVTIQSTEAWDDYQIPVAPYFVLVDGKRGVVAGEGAASSWELVENLLAKAVADGGYTPGRLSRRDVLLGRARTERIDRDLLEAGITPNDPRLYHPPASGATADRQDVDAWDAEELP